MMNHPKNTSPAVFIDRDGTLIEHVHYLTDPADVKLVPDAAKALRLLRAAGFRCIIVTNQSAIGRGMLTESGLAHIHHVLEHQLAKENASIDSIYFCPLAPSTKNEGDRLAIEHPDRKPGPGMLLRAATDHHLDLSRSFMVGDMLSDIYAGKNANLKASILIEGQLPESEIRDHQEAIDFRTPSILKAAQWICSQVNEADQSVDNLNVNTNANINSG